MFNFGLRRRWFTKNSIGAMKDWVEINRESKDESYCLVEPYKSSAYGEGYLISSAKREGISCASVLYDHLGRPDNLIYCSLEDENTLWFVIAKDGIIYGDHVLKLNSADDDLQEHLRNMLTQDLERFITVDNVSDLSVTIVCNDAKMSDDLSQVVLFGLFLFQTPYKVEVLTSDFDIRAFAQADSLSKTYGLHLSVNTKYPINSRVYKAGALVFFIFLLLACISFWPETKPKTKSTVKPTVIVDRFKNLKKLLTSGDQGVGIKQRFGFIVDELNAARHIEGYDLTAYQANKDASSITLKRDYGNIDAVRRMLPENVFYYQKTSGGLTAVRVTPKFPIFHTPVRANTFAEAAWIESALRYAWPDHIGEFKVKAAVKTKKGSNYTAQDYSFAFEGFFLEDLESMSSLFVGRSASFEEINFTVDLEQKSYSGVFKFKIIGVPDEHFGINKRKK
jgi:hypothetical protein